jgi:site-specific DNA recombinase
VIVAKLRAARMRKRQGTGRCEGRKPFGEHAGEEPVLHRIRQLYRKPLGRERLSYAQIAAQLNGERLPTRTGKAWRAGTVRRILQRAMVSS